MSVTKFKKRNKKTYFFMGVGVALVPMLVVCICLGITVGKYIRKNRDLEGQLSEKTNECGYVLTQDLLAGQQIEESMLNKIILRGQENTVIEQVDIKQIAGRYAKCNLCKGTVMNTQFVTEEEEYSSDMRIEDFDFVEINSQLGKDDLIDIRIAFPDGEDYIVARHKTVLDVTVSQGQSQTLEESGAKLTMKVTEEEMLRLASAYVDMLLFPNTRIYAVTYLDRFQPAGTVDYPVNPKVFQLLDWNPNVVDYVSAQAEQQYRQILEEHLTELEMMQ